MSGTDLDAALRFGPERNADALVLLLHGVGALPEALGPLASAIARAQPRAAVVALPGTAPFDGGGCERQWFSTAGVTDDNRHGRIAAALPLLDARIDAELARAGLARDRLALVGFSQGAMMALALATGQRPPAIVAALAGRLATPVVATSMPRPAILIAHGDADPVVPVELAFQAYRALAGCGFAVRLQLTAGLGHRIAPAQLPSLLEHIAMLAEPVPA